MRYFGVSFWFPVVKHQKCLNCFLPNLRAALIVKPFQPLADVQAPQHEEDASDESIVSSTPSTTTGTDTEEHDPAPERLRHLTCPPFLMIFQINFLTIWASGLLSAKMSILAHLLPDLRERNTIDSARDACSHTVLHVTAHKRANIPHLALLLAF